MNTQPLVLAPPLILLTLFIALISRKEISNFPIIQDVSMPMSRTSPSFKILSDPNRVPYLLPFDEELELLVSLCVVLSAIL